MTIETKLFTIIAIVVIAMFIVTAAFAGFECKSRTYCDKFGCYTITDCD